MRNTYLEILSEYGHTGLALFYLFLHLLFYKRNKLEMAFFHSYHLGWYQCGLANSRSPFVAYLSFLALYLCLKLNFKLF